MIQVCLCTWVDTMQQTAWSLQVDSNSMHCLCLTLDCNNKCLTTDCVCPDVTVRSTPNQTCDCFMIKLTNGMKEIHFNSGDTFPQSLLWTWDIRLLRLRQKACSLFRSYTTLSRLADTRTALRQMGQVEFSDSQRSMQCTWYS